MCQVGDYTTLYPYPYIDLNILFFSYYRTCPTVLSQADIVFSRVCASVLAKTNKNAEQ